MTKQGSHFPTLSGVKDLKIGHATHGIRLGVFIKPEEDLNVMVRVP